MRYTTVIDIALPRREVIALLDDPTNLPHWQPELLSFETVEGKTGIPGAKTILRYNLNGQQIEMIETILRRRLPSEFSASYETRDVKNWVVNRFYEEGPWATRWESSNLLKCSGLMMLQSPILRSVFRRQTQLYMRLFKAFAEQKNTTSAP